MYHFIGIKGSGMSSLAIIMKQLGYEVQGSDYKKHYFTEQKLVDNKIKILEFNKKNIKENMIIVKGNTFNEKNEEVKEAINKKLKIYTYQEMIEKITRKYNLIAICGCHGKTTTSSMISHILDSNCLIGDGTGKVNKSKNFVLEACEYKRHFLKYNPKYIVITNIELDHVDYYKNMEDVLDAYQTFVNKAKILIACGDDKNIRKIKAKKIYFYGIEDDNKFKAKNIIYSEDGIEYDYYIKNKFKYHFKLPFYGKHMVENTLAAITICYIKKMNLKEIEKKLIKFEGAKRRFKEEKILDNVIIDDYAHHPTEIKTVIEAARQKYPRKKIIAVFEPHTYSRTQQFSNEIVRELNKVDYAFIMDIYPSRESQEDYPNVTSKIILEKLNRGEYINKNNIKKLMKYKNSVLIFMSPNDLTELENKYKKQYKKEFDKYKDK